MAGAFPQQRLGALARGSCKWARLQISKRCATDLAAPSVCCCLHLTHGVRYCEEPCCYFVCNTLHHHAGRMKRLLLLSCNMQCNTPTLPSTSMCICLGFIPNGIIYLSSFVQQHIRTLSCLACGNLTQYLLLSPMPSFSLLRPFFCKQEWRRQDTGPHVCDAMDPELKGQRLQLRDGVHLFQPNAPHHSILARLGTGSTAPGRMKASTP